MANAQAGGIKKGCECVVANGYGVRREGHVDFGRISGGKLAGDKDSEYGIEKSVCSVQVNPLVGLGIFYEGLRLKQQLTGDSL